MSLRACSCQRCSTIRALRGTTAGLKLCRCCGHYFEPMLQADRSCSYECRIELYRKRSAKYAAKRAAKRREERQR